MIVMLLAGKNSKNPRVGPLVQAKYQIEPLVLKCIPLNNPKWSKHENNATGFRISHSSYPYVNWFILIYVALNNN